MDGMGNVPQAKPTITEVQRVICAAKGLTLDDMRSPSRKKDLTLPRQVAMALARELTGKSITQIGRAFNRDHTTVLYSERKIRRCAADNSSLEIKLDRYREQIAAVVAERPAPPPVVLSPPKAGEPSLRWASRNKRPCITHNGEWVAA